VVNAVEGGENSWAERQRNERSEITCGNVTEEKDIVNQLGNYADGMGRSVWKQYQGTSAERQPLLKNQAAAQRRRKGSASLTALLFGEGSQVSSEGLFPDGRPLRSAEAVGVAWEREECAARRWAARGGAGGACFAGELLWRVAGLARVSVAGRGHRRRHWRPQECGGNQW